MNSADFKPTSLGYQTSKNRVSMGLSLSSERMARLRELASRINASNAETVGRLIDAEWARTHSDGETRVSSEEAA